MSIVINDVAFVQARLSEFMSSFLRGGVAVIASLVTMALIHWPSALVLIGIMPLAARATGSTGKKIAGFSASVQQAMRVMTSLVLEVRGRFDFMRVQHGEEFDLRRFRNINESWFRTICRSILVRSAFAPALEFAGFAIFAAFIFALDRQWLGGGDAGVGGAGDFALQFVVALGFMVKPLREIGEQLTRYHETRGAVGKCFEMITPSVSEAANRTPDSQVLSFGQEILVRAVSFRWAGQAADSTADMKDAPALKSPGFSFGGDRGREVTPLTVAPGHAVAVVGPSGSGKSSMLKVFSGLARPQLWDANVSWNDLANSTALVPQQPYLFAASVRENICYGSSQPADEAINDTLGLMGLSELIASLPAGIETPVSSLTSNLSGGQIQRLVIARAWLRQKRVLLLDEATSALDPATEAAIMQRVVKAVRGSGRALLAVTHRLQCLELFDEIWFVEGGHVSLRGTRDQLMREPRFREFCQVHS
jgi:ABC-type multidrug transport system fused ATPase/permease subunit